MTHVGNISLQSTSFINGNIEYAILIGNPKYWRNSVGLSASVAILNHGFEKPNHERVYCGNTGNNIGMKRLAIQIGMVEEGRRRKDLFLNSKWEDVIEYGVLCEEFKGEVSRAK